MNIINAHVTAIALQFLDMTIWSIYSTFEIRYVLQYKIVKGVKGRLILQLNPQKIELPKNSSFDDCGKNTSF